MGLFLHFDMCYHCYRVPCNLDYRPVVYMDYCTVCEEELLCLDCGMRHDYSAYGASESDYARGEYEMDYPKTNKFFGKLAGLYYTARVLYNRG